MNEEKSLGYTAITLMISLAIFYDGVQFLVNFIPILGQALAWEVDVFAFLSFYVWFKTYNITFMTRARALAVGGAAIIELIPVLNDIPAWTASVLIVIGTTKGVEVLAKVSGSKLVRAASFLGQKMPGLQKGMQTLGERTTGRSIGGTAEVNKTITSHPAYSKENRQAQIERQREEKEQRQRESTSSPTTNDIRNPQKKTENVVSIETKKPATVKVSPPKPSVPIPFKKVA